MSGSIFFKKFRTGVQTITSFKVPSNFWNHTFGKKISQQDESFKIKLGTEREKL